MAVLVTDVGLYLPQIQLKVLVDPDLEGDDLRSSLEQAITAAYNQVMDILKLPAAPAVKIVATLDPDGPWVSGGGNDIYETRFRVVPQHATEEELVFGQPTPVAIAGWSNRCQISSPATSTKQWKIVLDGHTWSMAPGRVRLDEARHLLLNWDQNLRPRILEPLRERMVESLTLRNNTEWLLNNLPLDMITWDESMALRISGMSGDIRRRLGRYPYPEMTRGSGGLDPAGGGGILSGYPETAYGPDRSSYGLTRRQKDQLDIDTLKSWRVIVDNTPSRYVRTGKVQTYLHFMDTSHHTEAAA